MFEKIKKIDVKETSDKIKDKVEAKKNEAKVHIDNATINGVLILGGALMYPVQKAQDAKSYIDRRVESYGVNKRNRKNKEYNRKLDEMLGIQKNYRTCVKTNRFYIFKSAVKTLTIVKEPN